MDLAIAVALSLLMVPLMAMTAGALQVVLGLFFVLFFPGYTLIAALFPRKGDLDAIERLALSFGLSLAVVPLIGLGLNYTPWGIRPYPMALSFLLFVLIMASVAWYRRRKLPPWQRFEPQLLHRFSSLPGQWAAQTRWDRLLTILLVLAIAGAVGTLVYVVATPKVGERFTEFYILGLEGKAANYPREVILGDEARLILGIVNREQEAIQYRVVILIEGERVAVAGPVFLEHEGSWEQGIGFVPTRAGPDQKVEFRLYKGAATEPYLSLHLWVDVAQAP